MSKCLFLFFRVERFTRTSIFVTCTYVILRNWDLPNSLTYRSLRWHCACHNHRSSHKGGHISGYATIWRCSKAGIKGYPQPQLRPLKRRRPSCYLLFFREYNLGNWLKLTDWNYWFVLTLNTDGFYRYTRGNILLIMDLVQSVDQFTPRCIIFWQWS